MVLFKSLIIKKIMKLFNFWRVMENFIIKYSANDEFRFNFLRFNLYMKNLQLFFLNKKLRL